MNLNAYLFFNGNCKEAFQFYANVLGGEVVAMLTHAGTPAESHVSPEWRDKIMHARLVVGDAVLMGSDAPPEYYAAQQGFCVSLGICEPAAAERIFQALSQNGAVRMPMEETFFAARFGMAVDQFGTPWMVSCEKSA
jgi:PhnB protein